MTCKYTCKQWPTFTLEKKIPNNMQVGLPEDQSDRNPRAIEDRSGQEPMGRESPERHRIRAPVIAEHRKYLGLKRCSAREYCGLKSKQAN